MHFKCLHVKFVISNRWRSTLWETKTIYTILHSSVPLFRSLPCSKKGVLQSMWCCPSINIQCILHIHKSCAFCRLIMTHTYHPIECSSLIRSVKLMDGAFTLCAINMGLLAFYQFFLFIEYISTSNRGHFNQINSSIFSIFVRWKCVFLFKKIATPSQRNQT